MERHRLPTMLDNAAYNLAAVFDDQKQFHMCVKDIKAVCQEFDWNFEESMGHIRVRMCDYLKRKK